MKLFLIISLAVLPTLIILAIYTFLNLKNETNFTKEPLTIIGEVTKYTPDIRETDSSPDIMANGERVRDRSAACPGYLDFGQLIEVNGITYICRDRMARRYRNGNYIDLLTFDYKEAINFGRQKLNVKIYD